MFFDLKFVIPCQLYLALSEKKLGTWFLIMSGYKQLEIDHLPSCPFMKTNKLPWKCSGFQKHGLGNYLQVVYK